MPVGEGKQEGQGGARHGQRPLAWRVLHQIVRGKAVQGCPVGVWPNVIVEEEENLLDVEGSFWGPVGGRQCAGRAC